jgi:hypothetical protein
MIVHEGHPAALKKIINEVLGEDVSRMLLGRMITLLDEGNKDPLSLKNTCTKIEKMIGLLHGADKAKLVNERFRNSFSKAGLPEG